MPFTPKIRRRVVVSLCLCLLVAGGIGAGIGISSFNTRLKRLGIEGGVSSFFGTLLNPRSKFPPGTHRVNILLIGKDYNRDSKGMPYSKGARSDTLLVVSLDLDHRKVSALSIPRDLYVKTPDGKHGKINAVYAHSDGDASQTEDAVAEVIGVRPDYYIALKVDAVKTVVDALGGVEVTALDRMKYDDHWGQLNIDLPAGKQVVNGDQAIGFTRFRKVKPGTPHSREEGDDRRTARQQQLIRAVAQKAKTRFTDPHHWSEADKFILTSLGVVETNLTRDQMFALATLFRNITPGTIQSETVETTNFRSGRIWFVRADTAKMRVQVDRLLKGEATPEGGTGTPATPQP